MKQKIWIGFSLGMLAVNFTACSSLTFKKDADKVAQVKKVAIISISSTQPRTSGENIMKALTTGDDHGMNIAECTEAEIITPMATVIASALQSKAGLHVMPLQNVIKNPTYAETQTKIKKGGIAMLMASKNSCYHHDQVVDYYHWNRLRKDQVTEIKNALGVDAVIRILVEAKAGGTSVMGVAIGGAKTTVTLHAEMYNGIDDDAIWYDTNAVGDEVKDGTTSVLGFADRDVLNQKTLIGTQTAAVKLAERFAK